MFRGDVIGEDEVWKMERGVSKRERGDGKRQGIVREKKGERDIERIVREGIVRARKGEKERERERG